MAQVPTYDSPQVDTVPVGAPQGKVTGAISGALGQVAKSVTDTGAAFTAMVKQEEERQDKAVTDEAKAQILSLKTQMETEAHSVTGRGVMPGYNEDGEEQKDAPGLTEQYYGDFKESVNSIGKKLTPQQNEMLRPFVIAHAADLEKSLLTHEIAEREKWQTDQTKSLLNMQLESWVQAPDFKVEQSRAEAIDTLASLYSGNELEEKARELDKKVAIERISGAMMTDVDRGRKMLDATPKSVLDDMDRAKLMEIGQRAIHAKVADLSDSYFKNYMLPGLEKKTFVPDANTSPEFQQIKKLDPSTAFQLEKNSQAFNAGLAMDHFNEWMTGLSSSQRNNLVFEQVPQSIRLDLKQYDAAAYNTLAKRFDEEKQLRADRAAARRAANEQASLSILNAWLNPDSVNQNQVVNAVQSGNMKPNIALQLLKIKQEAGDIHSALKGGGIGEIINNELDNLVSGLPPRERVESRKRLAGTIYPILESLFTSKLQVTPEIIKGALGTMRNATLTRGSLFYRDTPVRAYFSGDGTDVLVDKEYVPIIQQRMKTYNESWNAAARDVVLMKSLGIIKKPKVKK